MNTKVRKLVIGLAVLGAMVGVYLGYLRVDESPELDPEALAPDVVRDPIAEDLAGGVGQIGEVRNQSLGADDSDEIKQGKDGTVGKKSASHAQPATARQQAL